MITLFTNDQIQERVTELAEMISAGFDELLAITVLNGAIPFSWDLLRQLTIPAEKVGWDTIGIESYDGTKRGPLKFYKLPRLPMEGKRVLLIEDIIDSGETIKALLDYLWKQEQRPKSISVCTLLIRSKMVERLHCLYGFKIPPKIFVYGYGMDNDERYRIMQRVCY